METPGKPLEDIEPPGDVDRSIQASMAQLTMGGHNAGIVSESGHPHRHFRFNTEGGGGHQADPEQWLSLTTQQEGFWWPVFANWPGNHSGKLVSQPQMGVSEFDCDAPGNYVFEV